MMRTPLVFIFFLIVFLSCNEKEKISGPKTFASADLYWVHSSDDMNYEKGEWMGNATFVFQDGIVDMKVNVSNMEPNSTHAMHLHEGTLEQPGRHWNKERFIAFCDSLSLGKFWLKPFAGDVGNIKTDANGDGTFELKTDLWSLGTNDRSDISGTVLFIHANSEDFGNECDPAHDHDHGGHMNPKIAGGTVVLESQLLE